MKVVVTGATGNVGSSLVRLLSRDDRVTDLVGISRRRPPPGDGALCWVGRDLATDDVDDVLEGADAVVHLAWAIQPSRELEVMHRINVGGSARVWDAAVRTGVPTIVHASSVGAYSPRRGDDPVAESWPTDGIPSSAYSRQKAYVERQLDVLERAHPERRVVRLRPGLIFKGEAATEIHRYFLGRLVPRRLLRPGAIPVLPDDGTVRFQAVHADDVARAYVAALFSDVRGPVNIAAPDTVDLPAVARVLSARTVPVPPRALRLAARATFAARLQPTPPGWVDLAQQVPIMDLSRAEAELGWQASTTGAAALEELLVGMAGGGRGDTPPLRDGPPG